MVNAYIANGGTLAPGDSAGTITISDLTLDTGAMLHLEIGDPNDPLASDRLVVKDNFSDYGGFLHVSARPGLGVPAVGTSWLVVDYSTVNWSANSGAAFSISSDSTGLGLTLDTTSEAGKVFLVSTAVPEPGVGALLALGVLLLSRRVRRST